MPSDKYCLSMISLSSSAPKSERKHEQNFRDPGLGVQYFWPNIRRDDQNRASLADVVIGHAQDM